MEKEKLLDAKIEAIRKKQREQEEREKRLREEEEAMLAELGYAPKSSKRISESSNGKHSAHDDDEDDDVDQGENTDGNLENTSANGENGGSESNGLTVRKPHMDDPDVIAQAEKVAQETQLNWRHERQRWDMEREKANQAKLQHHSSNGRHSAWEGRSKNSYNHEANNNNGEGGHQQPRNNRNRRSDPVEYNNHHSNNNFHQSRGGRGGGARAAPRSPQKPLAKSDLRHTLTRRSIGSESSETSSSVNNNNINNGSLVPLKSSELLDAKQTQPPPTYKKHRNSHDYRGPRKSDQLNKKDDNDSEKQQLSKQGSSDTTTSSTTFEDAKQSSVEPESSSGAFQSMEASATGSNLNLTSASPDCAKQKEVADRLVSNVIEAAICQVSDDAPSNTDDCQREQIDSNNHHLHQDGEAECDKQPADLTSPESSASNTGDQVPTSEDQQP